MTAMDGVIDAAHWVRRFNEIDFSSFPFAVTTKARSSPDSSYVEAMAEVVVKHVEQGTPLCIRMVEQISTDLLGTGAVNPHDVFRRLIQRLVEHEIDECIVIRGIRPFDPHVSERVGSIR